MTGQELFYALSFVDEKYVAEAETARISKTPWMKYLSVAACLCILLAGVVAMKNLGFEKAPAAAAPPVADAPAADAPAADAPAADAPPMMYDEALTEETAAPEAPIPAEDEMTGGELQHIPHARLRIVEVLAEGKFEAIVEADEPMEMDTQVILVVDPAKVPGADAEVQIDLRAVHTDAQIEIHDGAYDADSNTLYVAEVTFLCREDHE